MFNGHLQSKNKFLSARGGQYLQMPKPNDQIEQAVCYAQLIYF